MQSSTESALGLSAEERSHFFRQVLDNFLDGVSFTDRERRITYWNQAAERLSGYLATEVVGRFCDENFPMHVDDSGFLLGAGSSPLVRTLTDGRTHRAEVYLHHKNGHRVPVEVRVCPIQGKDGEVVGAVEIFNDNSRLRALRERAKELAKLAFLDPASQVGNRRYLEQQLHQELNYYFKSGTQFGLMLVDLDELKKINDTFGHFAGNAALVSVAKTVSACLRASDVVGRWGGDEFVAILPGAGREVLANAAEKCRMLIARSAVQTDGMEIPVTVSVGAVMVAPGDTAESIFKRADERLYNSKLSGRNRVSW